MIFGAEIKCLKCLKAVLIIVFAIILADIIKALAFKVKT
jgi:ABC-type transport system involved in cytochrome bd biosynthesis fused ATPase/permease subunit